MKHVTRAGMVCLGLVLAANLSMAQPPEYKYLGGWGDAAALLVCDAFILGQDKTDKIVEIHGEIAATHREGWQGFQDMSDDERQKMFSEYRTNVAADMKKECADVLAEEEIIELEALMNVGAYTVDADLRAIRHLDLNEEQRAKLKESALAVSKNTVPPEFAFFQAPISAEERAKKEEAFNKVKEAFTAKAKEVLTEEQQENWKKIVDEIKKEIEDQQERMRQFRQNN